MLDWPKDRVGRESVGWGQFNNKKENVKGRIKHDALCVFMEPIYKVLFAKYLDHSKKNHKAKYVKNLATEPACPSVQSGSGGEPGTGSSSLITRHQQKETCV